MTLTGHKRRLLFDLGVGSVSVSSRSFGIDLWYWILRLNVLRLLERLTNQRGNEYITINTNTTTKMPEQRAIQNDSRATRNPKNMVEFGRAMKPTPSEITIASVAPSTRSDYGDMFQDRPPLPPVPKLYAKPYFEYKPSPNPPEVKRSATPIQYTPGRQQHFDIALARLEGTYSGRPDTPPPFVGNDHPDDISKQQEDTAWADLRNRNVEQHRRYSSDTPIDEEQWVENPAYVERFAAWLNHMDEKAILKFHYDWEPELEGKKTTGRPRQDAGYWNHRHGWILRYLKEGKRPGGPDTEKPLPSLPREASVEPSQRNNVKMPTASPDYAAPLSRDPLGYYPYVASPTIFDGAGRKLKAFMRTLKDFVLGPPRPRRRPHLKTHSALHGRPAEMRLTGPPPDGRAITNALPLKEAQIKFLGRPQLSPLFVAETSGGQASMAIPRAPKPVKVVGDADRGTRFEDFINAWDSPEKTDETFAEPTQRIRSDDETQEEPPSSAAKYAAEYQTIIETPQTSPADFSEIQNGDFPTGQRVLYNPKLSSLVDMPRFEEEPPSDELHVLDRMALDEEMAKARREDRLRGFREKNVSKLINPEEIEAAEHPRRSESETQREESKKYGSEWQQQMPRF